MISLLYSLLNENKTIATKSIQALSLCVEKCIYIYIYILLKSINKYLLINLFILNKLNLIILHYSFINIYFYYKRIYIYIIS